MPYINNITCFRRALTLAEMLIAMAIMAVVFAVVLPQFEAIRNSWNSKAGAAETLQNGRILTEHMYRNLSTAVKITDVSDSSETNGYIEFETNDGNDLRYDVNSTGNYVEFGELGDLSDMAGPVSQLLFTCYDANDFDTPITDVNSIRFVRAEIIFTNADPSGRDKTFITSAHLRTNWNSSSSTSALVGWWKLDETSDKTAVDSSGNENDGDLKNMSGDEWTTGMVGGALEFDGNNDYVDLPIDSVIESLTDCTISTWVNWSGQGSNWQRIWDFGTGTTYNMFLTPNTSSNKLRFAITLNSWSDEDQTTSSEDLPTGWHHVAVVIDPDNNKHTLYLDGEVVAENTSARFTPSDLGSTNKNRLGRSQFGGDPYFDGLLDDVRIYNRILAPAEIAQLADVLRYREFTEVKTSSDVTSITISTPDTNEGDLLIAAVATDGDTSSSIAPPGGEGWSEIDIEDYSGQVTLGVWWKLADASDSSSHQFTWSPDEQAYAWMMRITGHKASNPINDYSASGESSSTPTSPEVTTTLDNCLILRLGAFDDDDITVDDPGLSSHTAITMDKSASSSIGQVTYEQFTETKLSYGTTSITISTPAGTSQGDLLIAAVVTDNDTEYSLSPPGGASWTEIDIDDYDNDVTLGVWWKLADASEPSSHQFTWSGSQEAYGWIMRFTGHNPSAPINVTATNGGYFHSPDCPSVTTTVANTMIVRIGGFDDDDVYADNPGLFGHTAITMDQSSSGNETCSGGSGYKYQTAIGSSGVSEFSLSGSQSEQYRTVTIAIAPVVSSGGTVSGGAGYTMQSTSGDSGTSNFSLGSSNQAQTLTIAIAPENESGGAGGGGGISP